MIRPSKPFAALLLAFAFTTAATAQDHWVGTWSTAPLQTNNTGSPPTVPPRTPDGTILSPQAPAAASAPARPAPPELLGSADITLNQVIHTTLGGSAVRVVFTNEYGTDPLTIGQATVMRTPKAAVGGLPAWAALTFAGKPGIVIPPGAIVVSDPAFLTVPAFDDLTIHLFLPTQTISHITRHTGALQTSYIQPGNFAVPQEDYTATPAMAPIYSWTFLKSVDVLAPANAAAVVAFGDSITDGAYATRDANARWPDDLARRLAANPRTANLSVLNEGIGGNRVLHDNTGPSALARFTRDALDQAGVRYVIILEAINDIGNAYTTRGPHDVVTADDLIQGYTQLIERAHIHGVKVIGATLTPYTGASYASPAGEQVRTALNQWIRTTKALDGVIDFDKATSDPAHPDTFLPAYDHGDHLHPTDAGLTAMSNAIDLSLFTK